MDHALLFFAFLWGLLGGKGSTSAPSAPQQPAPRPAPQLPVPSGQNTSTAPPWPQVVPSGLPPFPGSGWEYDEPPPAAVQQRAGQLLQQLWNRGSGAWKTEQTAGRWITYQAAVVASGKKGVVAFRQKRAALPRPSVPQVRATAPSWTAPQTVVVPARAPSSSPLPKTAVRSPGFVPVSSPARSAPGAVPTTFEQHGYASPLALPTVRYGTGLKPAAPSSDVAMLQKLLDVTPQDGRFGRDTQAAVIAYQKKYNASAARPAAAKLEVDGVCGPKTWTALFSDSTAWKAA